MNMEENCIPTSLGKDGRWSKEKSTVQSSSWNSDQIYFKQHEDFKNQQELWKHRLIYCFTSDIHEHFQTQA